MSKNTIRRVYWDACVWIAYINEESAGENRHEKCKTVLQQAKNGEIEIVTSTINLAEVRGKNTSIPNFPEFLESSFILLIPVDKWVGRKAHDLQKAGTLSGKPADSIHFATALQTYGISELHTYDSDLLKLDNKFPELKICKPTENDPLDLFTQV